MFDMARKQGSCFSDFLPRVELQRAYKRSNVIIRGYAPDTPF